MGFRVGQARTSRAVRAPLKVKGKGKSRVSPSVVRAPCEGEMSVSANDVED